MWCGPNDLRDGTRPLTVQTHSYSDNEYEYRHVQLPKAMLKAIPSEYHDKSKGTLKLLWEDEWRAMGITQVSLALLPYPSIPTLGSWLTLCTESRLGALRSARAGAAYPAVQVSGPLFLRLESKGHHPC